MRITTFVSFMFLLCSQFVQAQDTRPPFPWRFVKVSSLQTDIPEAGISTLTSAGIDGDGNVSITSSRRLAVHQFSVDGTWKSNLGKHGGGPGEFQATQRVSVAFNGEILVYDALSGKKFSLFDNNGEYLDSFADLLDGSVEGFHIVHLNTYLISSMNISPPGAERYKTVKLRDRTGNVLWSYNTEVESPYLEVTTEMLEIRFGWNPVGQDILWAVDPFGTAWILIPNQDQLLCVNSLGNELSSLKTDIPPLGISRSDWRQFIEDRFAPFTDMSPWVREGYNNLRDGLLGARADLRSIQRMWWAGSEALLVDRNVYQPDTVNHWALIPGRYAALLPDGRLSEEVEGPGGMIVASNGYALCLESLSDELPVLTLYRIESRR